MFSVFNELPDFQNIVIHQTLFDESPIRCLRLMIFQDGDLLRLISSEDFEKSKEINNRTTLAVAGNQIVLGLCCP